MRSRTNAQQELMRQQIIEEERNSQTHKYINPKPISINKINKPIVIRGELQSRNIIYAQSCSLNKRQRSASYTLSDFKKEPYSPNQKSPMEYSLSELGNDDPLDWSQIEPSIKASDISAHEILEQINRNDESSAMEFCLQSESDDVQDNNAAASLKASTSCPASMTASGPYLIGSAGANSSINNNNNSNGPNPALFINYHQHPNINNAKKPGAFQIQQQQSCSSNRTTPNTVSGNPLPLNLPDDQKLQWMRDRNKKDCHNRIERKRRDYINNQIQELGQLLPEKLFLSTESKRNKGGILKNSVMYIQQLQESFNCIAYLKRETQLAETIITALWKRIQALKDLLNINGIACDQMEENTDLQNWFNVHQNNSKILQKLSLIQSMWNSDEDIRHTNNVGGESSSAPVGSNISSIIGLSGSNGNGGSGGGGGNGASSTISSSTAGLTNGGHQKDKLTVLTNCDDVVVKEEAVSVETILNSGSLSRTQTISSGGGSSLAETPGGLNTTNINSSTSSSNNHLLQQPIVLNVSRLSSLNNHTSNNSNRTNSGSYVTGGIGNLSSISTGKRLSSDDTAHAHSSSAIQSRQLASDNPVLSSILIGNNSASSRNQHQTHFTSSFTSSSTSQIDCLSNSVPDSPFRNTFLTQTGDNERFYLIPITRNNVPHQQQQHKQQLHIVASKSGSDNATRAGAAMCQVISMDANDGENCDVPIFGSKLGGHGQQQVQLQQNLRQSARTPDGRLVHTPTSSNTSSMSPAAAIGGGGGGAPLFVKTDKNNGIGHTASVMIGSNSINAGGSSISFVNSRIDESCGRISRQKLSYDDEFDDDDFEEEDCIEISPDTQPPQDDSMIDGLEFDDIPME